MKNFFYILVFVSLSLYSKAQDPHFSQFFSSPLTLNPAFTGKFIGDYRLGGNHRNQWPEINNAFITSTAAADFHIFDGKMNGNDKLGVGFMFLSDASANSAVKLNYGSGSLAFHKSLDEDGNRQFSVGLQGTYSNFLINTQKLVFEDQLTSLGFTGQTTELFNGQVLQKSYIDANVGLLYSDYNQDKGLSYYIGLSAYHINKPQINFTSATYLLNPRYTLHAGGFLPINDVVGIHLSGLHSAQGATVETVFGGAAQITANQDLYNPVYLYFGSWMRLNDALIPYVGLEFSNIRMGLSYDVNTSNLKTASLNKGGIEFSLIYTHQLNTDRPINCPKF